MLCETKIAQQSGHGQMSYELLSYEIIFALTWSQYWHKKSILNDVIIYLGFAWEVAPIGQAKMTIFS